MRLFNPQILFIGILIFVFSCKTEPTPDIQQLISSGDFIKAETLLSRQISESRNDSVKQQQAIAGLETLSRIRKEFKLTREEVELRLKDYFPELDEQMMNTWESSGELEMRIIDGEKRYFNRAVSNFFRLNVEAKKRKETRDGQAYDGVTEFQKTVVAGNFENNVATRIPFDRKKLKITYTAELKANAVPAGVTVRCWLPFPKTKTTRSNNVELLSADADNASIAPTTVDQRSVYLEKKAVKDLKTVFTVSYTLETAAQWFNVQPEEVSRYDINSELYKKYTREQPPHIVFTEEIQNLARQIVGEEQNPAERVKLLYYWINDNIPWSGALEYSVMECIPEYVLEHRRGDCGMQTFLFLSMARSLGIPCKWQSGWYLLPQEKNLHDWAEVYYEGIGWVPVDVSFKLIDSDNLRVKEFYLNGIDSYRLVVNDDVSGDFVPKKKYYRSEPNDFQRGELEWKGGNLYFDTWDYQLEVEELPL